MRKKYFAVLCCFFFVTLSFAQNLVLNPSFENYNSLPCSWLTSAADFNAAMQNWTQPSDGSTDIFSMLVPLGCYANCFSTTNAVGHQAPRTGDVMSAILTYGAGCGFQPNYREYVQAELSQPLQVGSVYYAECHVSLGDFVDYGSNNIGMYFSTTMIYQPTCFVLNFTPQILDTTLVTDTSSWVKISGYFTATDTARYMIIGNFFDNASTQFYVNGGLSTNARYFIDDISVTEVSVVPVAIFTAPNQICPGTCTDFSNSSLNATTYLWTFSGANPGTSTDINPANICYQTPGSYDVTLIASGAGGTDTLTLFNYITVHPYPPPQGISQAGDTLLAIQGAVSYQWYFAGNLIQGATDYFYVAPQSGNYNVVATDANGCEVEAAIFDVTAQIISYEREEPVSISPNPVQDFLILYCREHFNAGGELSIYNLVGERIWVGELNSETGRNEVVIDVSRFAHSVYYLKITNSTGIYHTKFIKQ